MGKTVGWFLLVLLVALIAWWIVTAIKNARNDARIMRSGTEEERRAVIAKRKQRAAQNATQVHGPVRSEVVCPHCQVRGKVRCKEIKNKKGISGGKATGAILTGGASMLATGLSRKEAATAAYCENCKSKWQF